MNTLSNWVIVLLSNTFTEQELAIIAANWYRYNQFSISNASLEELTAAARTVLLFERCTGHHHRV